MTGPAATRWYPRERPVRAVAGGAGARWLTFDCYGTLVDWRGGISAVMEELAPGRGEGLLDAYYREEPAVQAERPFRRYTEVLEESLRRALRAQGVTAAPGAERLLPRSLPSWRVFDDVAAGLGAVRATGWRVGILSNIDRELFAGTLGALPPVVDAVVTAEDVGAYKPDHAHWRAFMSWQGVGPAGVIHVAQSQFHDVVPAHELGLRCIWINRLDEPADATLASRVLPDLRRLPGVVDELDAALS